MPAIIKPIHLVGEAVIFQLKKISFGWQLQKLEQPAWQFASKRGQGAVGIVGWRKRDLTYRTLEYMSLRAFIHMPTMGHLGTTATLTVCAMLHVQDLPCKV